MSDWFIDNFFKGYAKTASNKHAKAPNHRISALCGSVLDIKFKQDYFGMIINSQVSALQHDPRHIR